MLFLVLHLMLFTIHLLHDNPAVSVRGIHQNWSEDQVVKSSTWRELKAILLGLQVFSPYLFNSHVTWFTYCLNICSVVKNGSRVCDLQDLSFEIFDYCIKHIIMLDTIWIPRECNTTADDISRIIDFDDCSVIENLFIHLNQFWGPFTCDRFACHYNAKLPL